jgi:hypothetical protein
MKHYILGILLLAASLAFAQAEPDSEAVPGEQASLEESTEQTQPAEQTAPERTPEGYRIIRIDIQETKVYKDSVVKVQKEKELENREPVPLKFSVGLMSSIGFSGVFGQRDLHYYATDTTNGMFFGFQFTLGATALIPINQYNFAIRTGVLLDYADMPTQTDVLDRIMIDRTKNGGIEYREESDGNLTRALLSFPVLLAMKTMKSPVLFDIGARFSIPLIEDIKESSIKDDLIDNGVRSPLDIALLVGGEIIVSPRFLVFAFFDVQMNEPYKEGFFVGIKDIDNFGLRLGLIYNLL